MNIAINPKNVSKILAELMLASVKTTSHSHSNYNDFEDVVNDAELAIKHTIYKIEQYI